MKVKRMITNNYRPRTFSEVAGQDLAKTLLKSIVKNPDVAPKTLILDGEYGTRQNYLFKNIC